MPFIIAALEAYREISERVNRSRRYSHLRGPASKREQRCHTPYKTGNIAPTGIKHAVRTLDNLGRVVIPAAFRRGWGKRVILVRVDGDEVLVKPIRKKRRLTDYINTIEVSGVEDFTDSHSIRRAIYG